MGKFDNAITTSECGVYTIENTGTTIDTLYIKKFVTNEEEVYQFEDYIEQIVPAGDTFEFTATETDIYLLYWDSDVADTVILLVTCYIDACMLQYINKIVCCDDCLKCDETCEGTDWLNLYTATDALYTLLIDLMAAHFGKEAVFYPYLMIKDYDTVHTLRELMDKLDDLCSCSNC
jgi:hypothetical protein